MKTRNGFVSNSSSSSFVVIGREMDFCEVHKKDLDGVYCYGMDCGDGYDFFELVPAMFDFLSKYYIHDNSLRFYKVYHKHSEDTEDDFTKKQLATIIEKIPDEVKFKIMTIDASYHSTSDVKQLRDSYFPDIEIEDEEAAIKNLLNLREKKEKIQNSLKELDEDIEDTEKKISPKSLEKAIQKKEKK